LPGYESAKLIARCSSCPETHQQYQQHRQSPEMIETARAFAIRYNLLLKFLIGLGLALGLPPVSQLWLSFFCLSLLIVVESASVLVAPRKAFWNGFAVGLGYFCFALHWIGFAFLVDAKSDLWMMPFAVGGLASVMAVYWGIAFSATEWLALRGFAKWLVLPSLLGLAEMLRGYLFTGFPWAAPGLIADGMGGVLQLASLVGMTGLTVLLLVWGVLPGVIVLTWRKPWPGILLPVLLLLTLPACWWWGELRLSSHPTEFGNSPLIRLVQPNIAQSDKWRDDHAIRIFDDLNALTAAPSNTGELPKVIIWPESSVPFLLDENREALQRIAVNLEDGQTLLTGAVRRQTTAGGDAYFTSILNIDHLGAVTDTYDKWRLVPGGEYLPLAWVLEPLGFRKVVSLPESFSAGAGPRIMDVAGAGPAVMLICYEAIFPNNLVPAVGRARWIVNVTNDGWFGRSIGPYQHLAQVRMRAVEQGLPVARAANTGISALIDPVGRIVVQSELETQLFIDAKLPEGLEPTLYSRAGIVPSLLMVLFLFAIAAVRRKKITPPT
jgi:apolipoprotein N-acyltransferase